MSIDDDRLVKSLHGIVTSLAPEVRFYGFYEYEVRGGTGAAGFTLKSLDDRMPDLTKVNLWQDSTATIVYTSGARVLVGFVGGLLTRPFIAFDGAIIRAGDSIIFPTPSTAPVVKVPTP